MMPTAAMALRIPNPITRANIVSLYQQHVRAAQSFASYNFKEYFLRRSRHKFRSELVAVVAKDDESALRQWWSAAQMELMQLKRAAVVNQLYTAPKLVVEGRGKMMSRRADGAGADQESGGGGQPGGPTDPPAVL